MAIQTSSNPSSLNASPFSPAPRTLSVSRILTDQPRDSDSGAASETKQVDDGSEIMPDMRPSTASSIAFHTESNFVCFNIPPLHPGEALAGTNITWPAGTPSFNLPLAVRVDGVQHFQTHFLYTYIPEGSHLTPPSLRPQPSPMGPSPDLRPRTLDPNEFGTRSRSKILGSGRTSSGSQQQNTAAGSDGPQDVPPTGGDNSLRIQKQSEQGSKNNKLQDSNKSSAGEKRSRSRTVMTAKEAALDVHLVGLFQDAEVNDAFQYLIEKYLNGYYTLVPCVADSPRRQHAQASTKMKHVTAWFRAAPNPTERGLFLRDALRHVCNVMIVQSRVNCYDSRGWAPLHYIGGLGLYDLTSVLLKNGANALQLNREGKTNAITICRSRCAHLQTSQRNWLCNVDEAMQTLRMLEASVQSSDNIAAQMATINVSIVHRAAAPSFNPPSSTNAASFAHTTTASLPAPAVKQEMPHKIEAVDSSTSRFYALQNRLMHLDRVATPGGEGALQNRLMHLDRVATPGEGGGWRVPSSTLPRNNAASNNTEDETKASATWKPPTQSVPSGEGENNTVIWTKGMHFGPPSSLADMSGKQPSGNKYALLIALDQYSPSQSHLPASQGQVRNAFHFLPILQQSHGYSCALLDNEQATLQAVAREVRRLHGAANHGDAVVIYFTGHTTQDSICLYDGSLPFRELQNALAAMRTPFVSAVIEAVSVRAFAGPPKG
eukprot:g71489.t1